MKDKYMKFRHVLEDTEKLSDTRMNKYSVDEADKMMHKLDGTMMKIDFAVNKKDLNKVKLKVEFEGNNIFLFSRKGNGPIMFDSIDSVFAYMADSLMYNYQYSDRKAVYREVFDPDSLNQVKDQLRDYIRRYKIKGLSLTTGKKNSLKGESNHSWDMEVIFKRRRTNILTGKVWRMVPVITQDKQHGRIVNPNEVEVYDKKLWSKRH